MRWIQHLLDDLTVLGKRARGQVYNVAGGNEKKDIDIAKEILHMLSLSEKMIKFIPDRPDHDVRYSLDCGRIQRLGWKPQVAFEEGLQKTIDWYTANRWSWLPLVDEA